MELWSFPSEIWILLNEVNIGCFQHDLEVFSIYSHVEMGLNSHELYGVNLLPISTNQKYSYGFLANQNQSHEELIFTWAYGTHTLVYAAYLEARRFREVETQYKVF